jgi:hypothetical protein
MAMVIAGTVFAGTVFALGNLIVGILTLLKKRRPRPVADPQSNLGLQRFDQPMDQSHDQPPVWIATPAQLDGHPIAVFGESVGQRSQEEDTYAVDEVEGNVDTRGEPGKGAEGR